MAPQRRPDSFILVPGQRAGASDDLEEDTPFAHVRDLYLNGEIQLTLEAGDELMGWTLSSFRSADGTKWSRLPVVRTMAGELMIMVPMAFRLPAERNDGVGHA